MGTEDWLDKIFVDGEKSISKSNGMEKKKLRRLSKEADDSWDLYNELYKRRDNFRTSIPDEQKEAKSQIRIDMNNEIEDLKEQARELRRKQKELKEIAREKIRLLGVDRRTSLKNNEQLNAMKEQTSNAWDLASKNRNKFHKYYDHIQNKYKNDALEKENEQ